MITGKIYGPMAPTGGAPAIWLEDADDGWSYVLMIEPPVMPFPGMTRDDHVVAGSVEVYEAKNMTSAPTEEEMAVLQHMVYVKNLTGLKKFFASK